MNWTTAADIRKQVERRWKSGEILRTLVRGDGPFPMRLRLRIPSPREMAIDFNRAQEWVVMLRHLPGIRLECRSIRSQTLGRQDLPNTLWIDSVQGAVALLQGHDEADIFLALHAATSSALPELLPWLEADPLRAISLNASWLRLLQVAEWMKARPPHKVYIRQVDLPGIDSKFIEQHTSVLAELFDLVTTASSTDQPHRVASDFHTKYGFLREPVRIRFRILDPAISFASLPGTPDVELDEESFAALQLPLRRLFVTENKTNFLAFPFIPAAIVVFGAGYGMRAFGKAQWIHQLPIYYWGDNDTHGFAILGELRTVFPHARSFLMDQRTLISHQTSWSTEPAPVKQTISLLTPEESVLFEQLRSGVPREGIRLEQEKISLSWLNEALNHLLLGG